MLLSYEPNFGFGKVYFRMLMTSRAGAGIAGLGLLLTTASFGQANANSTRVLTAVRPRIAAPAGVRTASGPRVTSARMRAIEASCEDDGAASFVGVQNSGDYAAGSYSTAAGGDANQACDAYDAILGGYDNYAGNGGNAEYATISGGYANYAPGAYAAIGGGYVNQASGTASAIAGGDTNLASGAYAYVGAGLQNTASGADSFTGSGAYNKAAGNDSFVGAGEGNLVTGNGSVIGGGGYTYVTTQGAGDKTANSVSGTDSFLGAGDNNSVAASEAFMGSGLHNTISSKASYAALGGGAYNSVSGEFAGILGGYGNTASGEYSMIPGGYDNTASGELSFAGGYHATASHNGSFVWADYSSGKTLADTAVDQFVARASGGFYLYSNAGSTSGVHLAAGSGTWASLSDRNAKTAIVPVDGESILSKVASLPVSAWSYKTEHGVRHLGPMAQDFYSAFGVGEDDRHITSIDEDGVALAAIKTLNTRVETKDHEIDALRAELHRIEAQYGHGK